MPGNDLRPGSLGSNPWWTIRDPVCEFKKKMDGWMDGWMGEWLGQASQVSTNQSSGTTLPCVSGSVHFETVSAY